MQAQNFLFILSDQHTRRAIGAMGHPLVKTPNLDRLAQSGTVFINAYCNAPICVPSRASLATGRHAFETGHWDNCKPYCGATPSWGHRLAATGKIAASIGKLHYRSEDDDNGFEPELLSMHVISGVGNLFTICRDPNPQARKFRSHILDAGAGTSTYTAYDAKITAQAVEWLRTYGVQQDKPWSLLVSLVCPHPPWLAPKRFHDLYSPDEIELPLAHSVDGRPSHPGLDDFRYFGAVQEGFSDSELHQVTAAYYGLVSYLDDNIGQLLAALEASGLAASTRILYSSDHGESMGHKGMFGKQNMFEASVGVPMILAGADAPQAMKVDTPVQLIDVFPTVLDATGTPLTDEDRTLPGTSLFELVDETQPDRTILAEQHSAGAKSAVYMVRHGNYKYVRYMEDYPAQLFDLDADPDERVDLGSSPDHVSIVAEMESRLRNILDPERMDALAKADQIERLNAGGGYDQIVNKGVSGYTPAPGETPIFVT